MALLYSSHAHDADMWKVEWTNSDPDHDGWAKGEMYDTWLETGDLWVISKK